MTTTEVLNMVRQLINEVDLVASDLTDEELLQVVAYTRDELEIKNVTGFDALAVGWELDPPAGTPAYGVVPDPTLEEGYLLALGAAIKVLEQSFYGRLNRGELGGSWRSGLEEESTITAAQTYKTALDGMRMRFNAQVGVRTAPTSGIRIQ